MRALVRLGVATGARLGELLALCWTDVDLEAGIVRIGWSRRIVDGRMQVKGPKTEAGYRPVVLGPTTLALKRLHAEQLKRRLALGADYHSDAERRLARGPDYDHKDGGALALKVSVHPMAEGLARAGAHLDQVVGG
jgi:integrase